MTRETVLVTGGVGYVGRTIVRQLTDEDRYDLHVLDNLSCGEHRLRAMNTGAFDLHRCDIRNANAVRQVIERVKPDTVIHLAAVHYIPACERDPGDAIGTNVSGTVNLLHALDSGTRFVFASTAAVYRPSEEAHLEERGLGPIDIYGMTKLHAEEYVRYFHALGNISGTIVRLFNVVGPGETNPHLVPDVIRQLARGATRVTLGNLFPHRDYIDVEDAAEGFRRLTFRPPRPQKHVVVSNLGTGRTHSVEDVVKHIGQVANVTLQVSQDPTRIRAVDRPMLKASTEMLQTLTGWRPSTTLETSMRNAWSARLPDGLV